MRPVSYFSSSTIPTAPLLTFLLPLAILLSIYSLYIVECKINFIHRDTNENARHTFHMAMQPHMREMRLVRRTLGKMAKEMMSRKTREMQPSALLAHAMHLSRTRMEEDELHDDRMQEGIEGVGMLNGGIHDYMYQGDMLMDLRQVTEMMRDTKRMRDEEDEVRVKFPPVSAKN